MGGEGLIWAKLQERLTFKAAPTPRPSAELSSRQGRAFILKSVP